MIRRMELVDHKIFINVLNWSSLSYLYLSIYSSIIFNAEDQSKALYIISKYNILEGLASGKL